MKEKKVIDLGDLKEETLQGDLPFLEDEGKEVKEAKEAESPPFEFPTEEALEDKPPFMVEGAPEEPKVVDSAVEDKISSLEERLAQLDSTLANVRKLDEETEEKINKIEKSLEEMLHLYELVTNEMNPFVEVPKKEEAPPAKVDMPLLKEERTIKVEERELHLDKISNEPTFLMLMLKWLEFLLKKAGYVGMIKALLYYEELGWISESVRSKLIKYAEEIKSDGAYYGKRSLSIKDHMVSLFFISKLQGIRISPSVYASVLEELQELGLQE
jgi:archaellum component FlaD/FlaE